MRCAGPTEKDFINLAGGEEEFRKIMGDEEDDEVEEIQFMDFPHRPRYAMPPPKRGERFAAYHRESESIS